MAYLNGRLPASVLAPVPGGQLRRDAAAALNAMNVELKQRFGAIVYVPNARAYRIYATQVYLWNHVPHAHDTNWVAYPGTSNHGWGLAIDVLTRAVRWFIDKIGAGYGWSKAWSDAPAEWWHLKWRAGVWKGHVAGAKYQFPTLTKGYVEPRKYTRLCQRLLKRAGYVCPQNGRYDLLTRSAVKRFQHVHGLTADGGCGPKTWHMLLRAAKR